MIPKLTPKVLKILPTHRYTGVVKVGEIVEHVLSECCCCFQIRRSVLADPSAPLSPTSREDEDLRLGFSIFKGGCTMGLMNQSYVLAELCSLAIIFQCQITTLFMRIYDNTKY